MSKRLAQAVATAAVFNIADLTDKQQYEFNESRLSERDSKRADTSDDDSDEEKDARDTDATLVETNDTPYISSSEILNLSPLPIDDISRSIVSATNTDKTATNRRHRTNYRIDSNNTHSEVFSLSFSPDARWLTVGCGDGSVRILNDSGRMKHFVPSQSPDNMPITCIKYRPACSNSLLLATSADGSIAQIAASSGAVVARMMERDNQIYACHYQQSGLAFATAGRDAAIRIYDEQTKHCKQSLKSRGFGNSKTGLGHTNRIYGLRFHPLNDNMLVSGGWDNTVLMWDLRSNTVERSIYGPHICGDSLDISADGRTILTGSWRQASAVEEWDFESGQRVRSIVYNEGSEAGGRGMSEMIYAASYSPNSQYLAVGGCGSNDAKIRRCDSLERADSLWEDRIALTGGVYALAFNAESTKLAVAGSDRNIVIVDV